MQDVLIIQYTKPFCKTTALKQVYQKRLKGNYMPERVIKLKSQDYRESTDYKNYSPVLLH